MRQKPSGFMDSATQSFAGRFAPLSGFMGGSDTATTTLTVTIADASDPIIGAQSEVFTIQVTNTGSTTATSVSVTFTLDAAFTWVSTVGVGWTLGHTGQQVTATMASMAVGAANAITVTATAANATSAASSSVSVTCGNAATVNDTETTQINKVSRDATSGIYLPESSTEWTNFIAYYALSVAVPGSLWLLQEGSGNAADSIGAFTLTAAGTVSYGQALTGYTRLGVGLSDGVNSQFGTASASLPAGGAGSQAVMMIARIPSAPAANRSLYEGQTTSLIRINSTPRVVAVAGGGTSTGASNPTGTTRPFVYKADATGTTETVYTDQEKLSPAGAVLSGRNLRIGSSAAAPSAVVGYAIAWYNANAEISDANVKALLQAMGFSVAW